MRVPSYKYYEYGYECNFFRGCIQSIYVYWYYLKQVCEEKSSSCKLPTLGPVLQHMLTADTPRALEAPRPIWFEA